MKTRKILSTFLTCWSMLFSQMIFAEVPTADYVDPTSENVDGDNGARFDVSCSEVEGLDHVLTGIKSLVEFDHAQNCSLGMAVEAGKVEGGEYNTVKFCQKVEEMKDNGCAIAPIDPTTMDLQGMRNIPSLREAEIDELAGKLRNHAEELKDVAKLQFALSTDMKAAEHLAKMIWQEGRKDPQRKEILKNLFNLEDNFFSGETAKDSGLSMDQFIKTAFQCLPYSNDEYNSSLLEANPMCEGDHLPSGSQEVLDAAKRKMVEKCNADGQAAPEGENPSEACFFFGRSSSDPFLNIHEGIGAEIGAHPDGFPGNPVFLGGQQQGLQHLGAIQAMMGIISGDRETTAQIENAIDSARRAGWDPASQEFPASAMANLRKTALDRSVSMIMNQSAGLKTNPEKIQKVEALINALKNDQGYVVIPETGPQSDSHDALVRFYQDNILRDTPFNPETDMEIVGYALMAAAGQNHADYMVQSEINGARTTAMLGMSHEQIHVPQGPPRRGRRGGDYTEDPRREGPSRTPSALRAKYMGIRRLIEETRTDETKDADYVRGELARIFPEKAKSGLWESMVEFEARNDNSGVEAQGLAFGARSVLKMAADARRAVEEDKAKNFPNEEWTEQHFTELAQLEAMKMMAVRSAQKCNQLKQKSYREGQFCSPLASPGFTNQVLSTFVKDKIDKEGPNAAIPGSTMVYCTPILNGFEDAQLIQGRNFDPLNPAIAQYKFERCQSRSRRIFCGGVDVSCPMDTEAMKNQQIALFGQSCNAQSLQSEDHATRIGAAMSTDLLTAESADVTRTDIKSGDISINDVYNMEASDKKTTDISTIVRTGSLGSTSGYKSRDYKRGDRRPASVNASGSIASGSIGRSSTPQSFKNPGANAAGGEVSAASKFNPATVSQVSRGDQFMAPEAITSDFAEDVLKNMTPQEREGSQLAKLLERLASLEGRLTEKEAKRSEDEPKDASLTALEDEIRELREKLARSKELKERVAPEAESRTASVSTPVDNFAFPDGTSRVARNSGTSRGPASVNTGGGTTSAPVATGIQSGGGQSFDGGGSSSFGTGDGGDFTARSNTAYFEGSNVEVTPFSLDGVTNGSLIKLVSSGKLQHDDVVRFVSDAARNSEITENTRYVVTTEDGQILVYTPKIIDGEIQVEVSEYDPKQGALDIASLDTISVGATVADSEASVLRKPASEEEAGRVYREEELACILEGRCLDDRPTPLISE